MRPTAEVKATAVAGAVSLHEHAVEYTTHVHCDFRFTDVDEGFFGEN